MTSFLCSSYCRKGHSCQAGRKIGVSRIITGNISGPPLIFLQSQITSSLPIYVFQETDNNVRQNCWALIWTFGDVFPGFQRQGGSLHLCAFTLEHNELLPIGAITTDLMVISILAKPLTHLLFQAAAGFEHGTYYAGDRHDNWLSYWGLTINWFKRVQRQAMSWFAVAYFDLHRKWQTKFYM